jgi:hypothetical protein
VGGVSFWHDFDSDELRGQVESAALAQWGTASMNPWEYSSADILRGEMFVGGIPMAKSCPGCKSANVTTYRTWDTEMLKCHDCGAKFGGASARA